MKKFKRNIFESFIYVQQQTHVCFLRNISTKAFLVNLNSNYFYLEAKGLVDPDIIEDTSYFYLFIEYVMGSLGVPLSIWDEGKKMSKKDPRFAKLKIKKRIYFTSFFKDYKDYIGMLDLLYLKFYVIMFGKAEIVGERVDFVFKVLEYQKILKAFDKKFSRSFYLKSIYAGMPMDFRFLVRERTVKNIVCLDYFKSWI